MSGQKIVYDTLDEMQIPYQKAEHKPMFTTEDMADCHLDPTYKVSKNLFLRNAKGDKHYLVVTTVDKKADLKALAEEINSTRLSFGSEQRLDKYLGVKPGSVSAFCVLNDENREVTVVFDEDLKQLGKFALHPNENTATIYIDFQDVVKLVQSHGNEVIYAKL